MIALSRILDAKSQLTLAGAPAGFLPWLMTDLARAANGRTVFIASDEVSMRAMADAATWFAPEIEVLTFPAWDCLPYDRASPSLPVRVQAVFTLQGSQSGSGSFTQPVAPQLSVVQALLSLQ